MRVSSCFGLRKLPAAYFGPGDTFARRLAERCPSLRRVEMDGTPLGDDGLGALLALPELEWLHVARTHITAASMPALRQGRKLGDLDLRGLPWVTAHVAQLQRPAIRAVRADAR